MSLTSIALTFIAPVVWRFLRLRVDAFELDIRFRSGGLELESGTSEESSWSLPPPGRE